MSRIQQIDGDLAFELITHMKSILNLIYAEAENCTDIDLDAQIKLQGNLLTLLDCGNQYLTRLQKVCEADLLRVRDDETKGCA